MTLFPRSGQNLRAHSLYFQAKIVADRSIGITEGMAVTRTSATALAVASGKIRYNNIISNFGGGSITSIPSAGADKHRYDAIVYDCTTSSLKRIAGTEDQPSPYSNGFLNNRVPAPPELENESQILLAVIKVTSAGIINENYGNYAVAGVADLRTFLSEILGVTGGDSHNSLHSSAFAPIAKGVTNGDSHDHVGGDGAQIAHSSLSGLSNNDHSAVYPAKSLLTAAGDMIYASASATWERLAKGTNGYRLAIVSGLPAWIVGKFGVNFEFGNATAVLNAEAQTIRIPVNAKIKAGYVRSIDSSGALKSGSATLTIYKHALDGDIGTALDTFVLSSASSTFKTGLDISVTAGNYITATLTSVTTCVQIALDLELELT